MAAYRLFDTRYCHVPYPGIPDLGGTGHRLAKDRWGLYLGQGGFRQALGLHRCLDAVVPDDNWIHRDLDLHRSHCLLCHRLQPGERQALSIPHGRCSLVGHDHREL